MNCDNCGAPMELFERRKYFFCRYCGSFHFIQTPETDGVRVLDRSGTLPCPVCSATLAKALLDDVHPIHYCEHCRGVLLPRSVFVDTTTARRAFASTPAVAPGRLDERELQRHLRCPRCRQQMDVHPYYGPGNIVMDTCSHCDAIWLDFGELKQIVDAPGNDRGTRHAPPSPPAETPAVAQDSVDIVRLNGGSLVRALADFLDD